MDKRRWLFMRSWCAPLRKKLEIVFHDSTCEVESVYACLRYCWRWWRVDADAWRHVLKTYCGLRVAHRDEVALDLDAFSTPQFIFELEDHAFDNIDRISQVLADLLLPVVTAAKTRRLAEAARKIIAAGTEGVVSGDLRVDVPVALRFGAVVKPDFVTRVWSNLHELKERSEGWRFQVELTTQNEGDAAINCGVVIGPIGVHIPRLVTDELRTTAEDMVSRGRGLPIPQLALAVGCSNDDGFYSNDAEEDSEDEKAVTTGRLLERILCASGCAKEDRGEVQQLNSLLGYR